MSTEGHEPMVDVANTVDAVKKVVLTFHNVSVKVEDPHRVILNGVSGVIGPGLTAIIGPTGSGKSTLLNTLSGYYPAGVRRTSGTMHINGKPYTPQSVHFSYCMQTEELNGHLTVWETMMYAAKLALPALTHDERATRIEAILLELGLLHVRHVLVGTQTLKGISGGQRKRVGIALALLTEPPLLLLDEPTAGLDSVTALNLVQMLKDIAVQRGVSILCVIHQPQRRIFDQLDELWLMRGGSFIYTGPAARCVDTLVHLGFDYDGVSNPADFIAECISPLLGETLEDLEARCPIRHAYVPPVVNLSENSDVAQPASKDKATAVQQFIILFTRSMLHELRDRTMHVVNLVVLLLCGFLIGGVWFQLGRTTAGLSKRLPALFFCCINQSLFGAMKAVLHFPEQRRQMLRERRAKFYTALPAFLSVSLVDLLIMIPWSIAFSVITYFMIGFRTDGAGHFFVFAVVLILEKYAAQSIATMLAASTWQATLPTVVLPVVLELSRLFGGFFLPPALLPSYFQWLDPLSYIKYAYLAVAVNELRDLELCSTPSTCSTTAANAQITSLYLDYLEPGPCIAILITFSVGTRIIAYALVRFKKT